MTEPVFTSSPSKEEGDKPLPPAPSVAVTAPAAADGPRAVGATTAVPTSSTVADEKAAAPTAEGGVTAGGGGGVPQRTGADYTGTSLKFFHSLGLRRVASKTVEHVNDESLVYIVGKHVAIFNYENKTHRFILKNSKTAQVVAFAVSSNRRYIALSERLTDDNATQVSVYNFNTASRVRTLSLTHLSKQPVTCMDFSRDNKYLVTVTEAPDVFIYLWQLDKARLLGAVEVKFACQHVSISPWAHWKLCTTGTDTLRVWHFADKQMMPIDPFPKKTDYRFTSHAWFDDDKVIVGTEQGDILILVGDNTNPIELKKTLTAVHGGAAIQCLVAIGRGFVCGGEQGQVSLYERTYDSSTFFQLFKKFTASPQRIVDLSISPNEESVVCVLEGNEMLHFSLSAVDVHVDEQNFCKMLPIGFHSDTVTAIDVCVQKAIVVTASVDKTVRVWNFLKKKLEVCKFFDDEVWCIACHPTGLRLLVGFKFRLCMCNVLVNDLHICTDFPVKNCREVRFSPGGQYFAAVVVNRIQVYNAYSFELIGSLQGHSSMVKSICWTKNDLGLVSAGFEGAVYEWKLEGLKREDAEDNVVKSIAYSSLRYDDTTGMIAAVGSSKQSEPGIISEGEVTLRQILRGQEQRVVKPGSVISGKAATKLHTSELAICSLSQTLFLGTTTGQLLLYKWPLPENVEPYQRYDIHQGEIVFVLLSPDEKYLFTVGEDHSLFMFDVDIILEGRPVSRKSFNYAAFDDVSYVLQHEMEDRVRAIESLKVHLDDFKREREKEVAFIVEEEKKLRETFEDHSSTAISELEVKVARANRERDKARQVMVETEKQLESLHMKAAEELEALYQKRYEEQQSKFHQLKDEKDELVVRYENKIFKVEKSQEEELASFLSANKEVVAKLSREVEELKLEKQRVARENDDMFQETCVEYEMEVEGVKAEAKERLKKESDEREAAKSQSAVFKKKFDGLQAQIKDLKLEREDVQKQVSRKEKKIEDHEKAIKALRDEINHRNDTISTSEKKILELKKQTAELEKLRYVLTFKYNELRKEVAPKEEKIKAMNESIQEMDEELERAGINRDTLKSTLEEKDEQLISVMEGVKENARKLTDQDRFVAVLLRDLTELVAVNDPRTILPDLAEVVTQYRSKYHLEDPTQEREKNTEFERQKEYMTAQISSLRKNTCHKEEELRHDNTRKTSENTLLVKEINDLRQEKKNLGTKLALAEMHLKETRALIAQQVRGGGSAALETPSARAASRLSMERASSSPSKLLPPGGGFSATLPPVKATRGRLMKGSTVGMRDLTAMDPRKVAEIIATVERNNSQMKRQQVEIRRLREFVQHLLARAEKEKADRSATADQTSPTSIGAWTAPIQDPTTSTSSPFLEGPPQQSESQPTEPQSSEEVEEVTVVG